MELKRQGQLASIVYLVKLACEVKVCDTVLYENEDDLYYISFPLDYVIDCDANFAHLSSTQTPLDPRFMRR